MHQAQNLAVTFRELALALALLSIGAGWIVYRRPPEVETVTERRGDAAVGAARSLCDSNLTERAENDAASEDLGLADAPGISLCCRPE